MSQFKIETRDPEITDADPDGMVLTRYGNGDSWGSRHWKNIDHGQEWCHTPSWRPKVDPLAEAFAWLQGLDKAHRHGEYINAMATARELIKRLPALLDALNMATKPAPPWLPPELPAAQVHEIRGWVHWLEMLNRNGYDVPVSVCTVKLPVPEHFQLSVLIDAVENLLKITQPAPKPDPTRRELALKFLGTIEASNTFLPEITGTIRAELEDG